MKVKKDLIEFQLGGGGFGTFGDDTSTSANIPLLDKSSREKELEKRIKDEDDRDRRRRLERELDDLRDRRESENRRIMAERARIEEAKRERIADERLRGGSRFNLRYEDRVPAGMRPEDVMAALAEYVDFGGRPGPSAAGAAPPTAELTMLRKGLSREEAERLFGAGGELVRAARRGPAGHHFGVQCRRSARPPPILSTTCSSVTRLSPDNPQIEAVKAWLIHCKNVGFGPISGRMLGTGERATGGFMKRLLTIAGLLAMAAPGFAADSPKQVTFSKDVAPIFQKKCQECHQPNSIAPMSLITYQEARPWARSIKERVATRQMPPWHIDKTVGVQHFKNDMSLSDEQIDTIVRWVDAGAPQGDPKDMPPPVPLVTDNGWKGQRDGFGPPDLTVKSPEYTMPAEHQDVWFRPMSDIPMTEPRWVKMVEIRPTNMKSRKIIHHSIAYLVLNNDPDAVNQGTANGPDRSGRSPTIWSTAARS